jgi:hypothetical protein
MGVLISLKSHKKKDAIMDGILWCYVEALLIRSGSWRRQQLCDQDIPRNTGVRFH